MAFVRAICLQPCQALNWTSNDEPWLFSYCFSHFSSKTSTIYFVFSFENVLFRYKLHGNFLNNIFAFVLPTDEVFWSGGLHIGQLYKFGIANYIQQQIYSKTILLGGLEATGWHQTKKVICDHFSCSWHFM